jgi:hypothetical protein
MAIANRERGEVDLTVEREGSTVTFVLKLSMNAAVALEKRRGKSVGEVLQELARMDFVSIRDVMHLLLQKHHAKEFSQIEAVGNLCDEIGLVKAVEAINAVMEANAPEGKGNPPTAAASTGDSSSSTPAA